MKLQTSHGGEDTEDSVWRPPTVGIGKLLWFITPREFDLYQAGELSLSELENRVADRDDGQRPLSDFGGGD